MIRRHARHAARGLMAALLLSGAAHAHSGGAAYVTLAAQDGAWVATIDLALPEVATEAALDRDGDGALRWREVLDGAGDIQTRLRRRLQLSQRGAACRPTAMDALQLMRRATGAHVRIVQRYDCPQGVLSSLEVDARQWLQDAPDFGVYVTLATARDRVALLAGRATSTTLTATTASSALQEALRFLRLGFEHLLTGYDHLAFLALLLLGAMRSAGQCIVASQRKRSLMIESARVITGFTAAHSLTLALAATGTLRLPGAPVEIAIALSIVVTALGLVFGRRWSPDWRVAFGFGLIHGLGFAGLLTELLQGAALVVPLVAFNLGLEMAQLLLVAASLPLLLWLQRRPAWAPRLASGMSVALALLGSIWLVERL